MIGVAISTTGDDHRLEFLETSVDHWKMALPTDDPLFVTVDGSAYHLAVVENLLRNYGVMVIRVGQPESGPAPFRGRCGVAANKNTGIEALMELKVDRMFLSDDDTWPLGPESLTDHIGTGLAHSMVCWGRHRRPHLAKHYAAWAWPRGAMLYVEDSVIATVGGMIEEFGRGGHEHVEWSRRIYQAGFTPAPFPSPVSNYEKAIGASRLWHAEDMPHQHEGTAALQHRRQTITTMKQDEHDWPHIQKLMADKNNDTSFVPFRAVENGRTPATMSSHSTE